MIFMLTIDFLKTEYKNNKDLWRMLEALDIITLNHSIRVCEICRYIEEDLGFPTRNFSEAGLFHDIGKYFVSTHLLNKRGKLSSTERVLIDLHCYL